MLFVRFHVMNPFSANIGTNIQLMYIFESIRWAYSDVFFVCFPEFVLFFALFGLDIFRRRWLCDKQTFTFLILWRKGRIYVLCELIAPDCYPNQSIVFCKLMNSLIAIWFVEHFLWLCLSFAGKICSHSNQLFFKQWEPWWALVQIVDWFYALREKVFLDLNITHTQLEQTIWWSRFKRNIIAHNATQFESIRWYIIRLDSANRFNIIINLYRHFSFSITWEVEVRK